MRPHIRETIAAIAPFDALEAAHIADTLAWIDSGAELCRLAKPATPPRHLVSYFACVAGNEVLLVDHINAQLWLPTGGHVEPGEDPRDTVLREAREELGIEHGRDFSFRFEQPLLLTVSETVGLTAGHTDVSLWYVLDTDRHTRMAFDASEFHGIRWFSFDDAPLQRSDPHLGRFLAKLVHTQHTVTAP